MSTKRAHSAQPRNDPASLDALTTHHKLIALLHTMRCISQYEDTVCELSHDLKRSGQLSPAIRAELREIIDRIPSYDFVSDLKDVRTALEITSGKSAQSPAARKVTEPAKKKSRRKSSK